MKTRYEAIVVGGGVAGSSAAIRLAEKGVSVLLLEKDRSADHKVCGEFLSGETLPLLRELGIDPDDFGAVPIGRLELRSRGRILRADLPFQARGLSRKELDRALIDRARSAGADVLRPRLVTEIRRTGDGFSVLAKDGEFHARQLFWASGKSDMKRILQRRGTAGSVIAFKRHLRVPSRLHSSYDGKIELHLYPGGYAGLSQVEGGSLNFCFIVDKEKSKSLNHDWNGILRHQASGNERLREVFAEARWEWEKPLSAANIPYGHVYQEKSAEFFVLGDQFAVIPSLAGDGMAMALVSAKEAVAHFLSAYEDGAEMRGVISSYNRKMQMQFRRPMIWGGRLQKLFGSPQLTEWSMEALARFPRLGRHVARGLIERTRCLQ